MYDPGDHHLDALSPRTLWLEVTSEGPKGCNQYQKIAIILEINDIPRATSQYDIKFAPETPICNTLVAPRDVEKTP